MSSKITPREYEIVKLLAKGFTDKEVAYELKISKRTVQTHVVRIILKLKAKNRVQAVTNYIKALDAQNPTALEDFYKW